MPSKRLPRAPAKRKPAKSTESKNSASTPLYVLSDATGSLARHMVTTFLTQFPAGAFALHLKPFIAEHDRLTQAMADLAAHPGIVFHAVVSSKTKRQITDHCRKQKMPCYDLTGPAVDFLAAVSKIAPNSDENRLHPIDAVYCDRINAMTYTVEHDDGLGLDTLGSADIVLAGVSRTGKTPTSVYLAMQGYRVANVSLAIEVAPPPELLALRPGSTVGLILDPMRLVEIRTRRQTAWNMAQTPYSEMERVEEEVAWSRKLFAKLRCPVLDVTDQAIEETAARLLDLLHLSQPPARDAEGLS
jgi:regulator of PEP synthase PpsR (kinase-PPPase family)